MRSRHLDCGGARSETDGVVHVCSEVRGLMGPTGLTENGRDRASGLSEQAADVMVDGITEHGVTPFQMHCRTLFIHWFIAQRQRDLHFFFTSAWSYH